MSMNSKFLSLLFLCLTLSGCKVAVVLVEGGEVISILSGTCLLDTPGEGKICIHEVNDTQYSEAFTAVPEDGWEFVKWNSGGDFLCPDSTDPTCVVSNVGTTGIASIESIVDSDKAFYIMPVFREIPGLPITDTVNADGKEWAQVDLFTYVSWDEINAACPAGECNGKLNDYDMTGWTWASLEDVNSLFTTYITGYTMGPNWDRYSLPGNSTTADSFFAAGWRYSSLSETLVLGYTATSYNPTSVFAGLVEDAEEDVYATDVLLTPDGKWANIGAWFYRTP